MFLELVALVPDVGVVRFLAADILREVLATRPQLSAAQTARIELLIELAEESGLLTESLQTAEILLAGQEEGEKAWCLTP